MNTFFDEITACLSKAAVKYENIIIMGDFNIDIKNKGLGYGKLDTLCDLFNHTNLIHSETCLMKNHNSTIDLFLTNTPKYFFKTRTIETSLSDYHKLISTFCKSRAPRLKPKTFLEAIDKYAPLKKKLVRGNQAPFMNRDFQKATYTLKPD